MDTEEEASAVLEALKAENEQASKLKKEAPRKLPPTPKKVPLSQQHTLNILLQVITPQPSVYFIVHTSLHQLPQPLKRYMYHCCHKT